MKYLRYEEPSREDYSDLVQANRKSLLACQGLHWVFGTPVQFWAFLRNILA